MEEWNVCPATILLSPIVFWSSASGSTLSQGKKWWSHNQKCSFSTWLEGSMNCSLINIIFFKKYIFPPWFGKEGVEHHHYLRSSPGIQCYRVTNVCNMMIFFDDEIRAELSFPPNRKKKVKSSETTGFIITVSSTMCVSFEFWTWTINRKWKYSEKKK